MNVSEYYSTSDLSVAGCISLFFPVNHIDGSNPKRAVFVFRREEGVDHCVEGFWSGELKVSPREYFYQLKYLKSRLYEERGQA